MSISRQSRDRKLQREFRPKDRSSRAQIRFTAKPRYAFHRDPRRRRQQLRPIWKLPKAAQRARQRELTAAWKVRQVERMRGK